MECLRVDHTSHTLATSAKQVRTCIALLQVDWLMGQHQNILQEVKKKHEDWKKQKKLFFSQGLGVGSEVWNLKCLEHECLLKDLKGTGLYLEKFKK